jgi:Dodecin
MPAKATPEISQVGCGENFYAAIAGGARRRRTRGDAEPEWARSGTLALGLWEKPMAGSVYTVVEIIGTSTISWEAAAKNAIEEPRRACEIFGLLN